MQVLHRARDRLVAERTALINQLRAVLMERGIVVPQGRRKLSKALAEILEGGDPALSVRVCTLIKDMREEWCELDRRICAFDNEFAARAREDERARRLATIPGIGVLNATALVAAVGDGQSFARGRDLSAWLGLVPRQQTTGGRPRLKGITKRGNVYLRKLLIHGARAAITPLSGTNTLLGKWLRGLRARAHINTVVVALANKLGSPGRYCARDRRRSARSCRYSPVTGEIERARRPAQVTNDVCGWWE